MILFQIYIQNVKIKTQTWKLCISNRVGVDGLTSHHHKTTVKVCLSENPFLIPTYLKVC